MHKCIFIEGIIVNVFFIILFVLCLKNPMQNEDIHSKFM